MSPSPASSPPPPFLQPQEADLPGFQTPPAPADDPSASHDQQRPSPSLDPWDGPDYGNELGSAPSDAGPAEPSTRKQRRSPASTSPDAFVGIFKALLQMVTFFVHLRLAPKHVENSVWIADAEDLVAIAEPLSRIAARHSPIDAGPAGDVGDAIEASIAVGGYSIKNMIRARELAQPVAWAQQDEADQAAAAEPSTAFQPFPPTL